MRRQGFDGNLKDLLSGISPYRGDANYEQERGCTPDLHGHSEAVKIVCDRRSLFLRMRPEVKSEKKRKKL
jgi:hypothetical protein